MLIKRRFGMILLLLLSMQVWAADYDGFTVKHYNPDTETLGLYLKDNNGAALKSFARLKDWLASQNQQLIFAMNAGIYKEDLNPLGLLVINGKQLGKLNLRKGLYGNFYMQPNGVFLIKAKGARIVESSQYPKLAKGVQFASQSGPLLVQNGVINSSFNSNATSRLLRNGVGIADNDIYFVISDKPVNFYEFASFFKDTLKCNDALYFDGSISAIYSEELNRDDQLVPLGPMIGLIRK